MICPIFDLDAMNELSIENLVAFRFQGCHIHLTGTITIMYHESLFSAQSRGANSHV